MFEWLNENEGRSYPFVDAGKQGIPDELVVDLIVSGPADDLVGAYLSSLVVRNNLISLSIAGPSGGLLVFTAASPTPYAPLGMTPVRNGIGGYVSFGAGMEAGTLLLERRDMSFDPVMVDPGCLRALDARTVTSIGKSGVRDEDSLRGIVNLEVSPNMTISHQDNVVTLGLREESRREFVSKCDKSAVFDECGRPPIRNISGVSPNEDGVIWLEFDNG